MSNDRLKYLLEHYSNDSATPEETSELFVWINNSKNDSLLKAKVNQLWEDHHINGELPDIDWKAIYSKVINTPEISKKSIWPSLAVAIAIVGVLLVGSYIFFLTNTKTDFESSILISQDIKAPETNRATITLADGSIVYLDSAVTGQVASQKNVKIVKLAEGQIDYQSIGENDQTLVTELNTLHNPKGSKVIMIKLSDGSFVWLNSGSSITYPVKFGKNERSVAIIGEAYFEVERDLSKPFLVQYGDVTVSVLGTHFNVNAYEDEDDERITLLEGSVRVNRNLVSKLLKPGQQAKITSNSNKIKVLNEVNLVEVMAWRDAKFMFDEKTDIKTIMRQISRWYNVDIEYRGEVTQRFWGTISKDLNVSHVLKILETTGGVKFNIENNKIIVLPHTL